MVLAGGHVLHRRPCSPKPDNVVLRTGSVLLFTWKSTFHIKTEISQNEPMFHETNWCFTRGHLGSPTSAGRSCHIPLGQSRNQSCTHPSPEVMVNFPIFNNSQTCPPVLPRPYCLPSTKPASQSVLEFICCNQIYIWDNMILLTVWIQSPHDDLWTSLPDDPVIEASTIDEPHSSFSVLPQVEPGGIVHELSSCDP